MLSLMETTNGLVIFQERVSRIAILEIEILIWSSNFEPAAISDDFQM